MKTCPYSTIKGQYSDLCPIELRPFEDNDKIIILNCNHIFCEKPLKQWCKINPSCPLCKKQIHFKQHDKATQQIFLMYFGEDLSENFEEVDEKDIIGNFVVYSLSLMLLFSVSVPIFFNYL